MNKGVSCLQALKKALLKWLPVLSDFMARHYLTVIAVCLAGAVVFTGLFLQRKVKRAEALIEELPYEDGENQD